MENCRTKELRCRAQVRKIYLAGEGEGEGEGDKRHYKKINNKNIIRTRTMRGRAGSNNQMALVFTSVHIFFVVLESWAHRVGQLEN